MDDLRKDELNLSNLLLNEVIDNKENDNFNNGIEEYRFEESRPEDSSMGGESGDKRDAAVNRRAKGKASGKRNSISQLVLIALLSSMLGAGTVFAAISLVPAALGRSDHAGMVTGSSGLAVTGVGAYKSVTIEQSNSVVSAVAEKAGPSVVGIKVTAAQQQNDFFFGTGDATSEGSGIIISQDGYILTNNHVVEGALTSGTNDLSKGAKIEVILPDQTDKAYEAKLIGRDSSSDLAVLKIEASGLTKAELGNSDGLKAGELAVAIGNPGGLDYMGSVTAGIISGLNRTLTTSDGKELHLIQTDAAINPGNSGGALCNATGQVIGINTVKIAATGYEGLGFAIPINDAKQIAQDLIDYKYVKGRPLLGLSIDQRFTQDVAAGYNVPVGLLVGSVTANGPAETAGIKGGDIITKFDGKDVKTYNELETQKSTHKPGDRVILDVYRDGKTLTLTVTLGEQKI